MESPYSSAHWISRRLGLTHSLDWIGFHALARHWRDDLVSCSVELMETLCEVQATATHGHLASSTIESITKMNKIYSFKVRWDTLTTLVLVFFFIFGNDSHLEILSELAWRASQKLHRENNENYINDNGSSASSGIEFTRVSFTFLLAFVSIREWKNAKIWKCAKQFLFFLSFFLFSLRFFRIAIIVERKATEKWPSYINRLTLCVLSFSCQSSSLSRRWWCFHDDAELFQSLFSMQLIQFSGRNLQLVSE